MGCGYCLCCSILVIINVFYMLIGIALAAAGIFVKVGQDLISKFVEPLVSNALNNLNSNGNLKVNSSELVKGMFKYLESIYIFLIVIGSIIIVLSILGMASVCCKTKACIVLYITIVSLIVLIQIITAIVFAADPKSFKNALSGLVLELVKKYTGFLDTNIESMVIDLMNLAYNCCGAKSYLDFDQSSTFKRIYKGSFTYGGQSKTYDVTLKYPISCCASKDFKFVNIDDCINNGGSNNQFTGCVDQLYGETQKYLTLVLQVAGGIIGFQVLIIIPAAICLVIITKESRSKPV